jgi:transcription antitermination factor NusG
LPLFPCYIFVHFSLDNRLRVLQLLGVLKFVSFQGRPAVLAASDIEILRNGLDQASAEPYPYLTVGRRVRIHSGPVAGLEGVLVRRKNKIRVVVSIDSIQRSMAVEVDASEIELASR